MGTTNVTTRGSLGAYIPCGFTAARGDIGPAHQWHGGWEAPKGRPRRLQKAQGGSREAPKGCPKKAPKGPEGSKEPKRTFQRAPKGRSRTPQEARSMLMCGDWTPELEAVPAKKAQSQVLQAVGSPLADNRCRDWPRFRTLLLQWALFFFVST